MDINKLIQIKENKYLTKKYISSDIISLEYNNIDFVETDNKITIKLIEKGIYDIIIGFSMNLKSINIQHYKDLLSIERISKIRLDSNLNDLFHISLDKPNEQYEIYIKIDYFSENINLDKTILNTSENMITNKKIKILLTKFIISIGEYFKLLFEKREIKCEIITSLSIEECLSSVYNDNITYIILYNSEKHNLLPRNFIFYQIEQPESVFLTRENYLKRMVLMGKKSIKFWEYSKIASEIYYKYLKNKIQWVPMPFVSTTTQQKWIKTFDICDYDIFFYGNKNFRRENILNELSRYFKVKMGWGYYGDKKLEFIGNSKIIINLHYYPNAGLETCRINEILNFSKIIISEKSETDKENMELYKDVIIFVENIKDDLTNIKELLKKIKYFLDKENYLKKMNQNKKNIIELENKIDNLIKI
jgi:hypothetical protein